MLLTFRTLKIYGPDFIIRNHAEFSKTLPALFLEHPKAGNSGVFFIKKLSKPFKGGKKISKPKYFHFFPIQNRSTSPSFYLFIFFNPLLRDKGKKKKSETQYTEDDIKTNKKNSSSSC